MENRLKKLREKIKDYDGIIISNPINAKYFTGITSSNITLFITKKESFLFTDFRYKELAQINSAGFEVVWENNAFANLCDCVSDKKSILIETDYITYDYYSRLTEKFPSHAFIPTKNIISDLRIIKDATELEYIKKACEIADNAYAKTLPLVKEGMTELELKSILEYNMKVNPSFDTIVLFGSNTSLPHGQPSDRKLKNNDIILMDFGSLVGGYGSDMTRTIFFGKLSSERKKAYDTVLEAHKLAVAKIEENLKCSEADKEARDYINNCGYVGCFGHSLGHGIGLDLHELPYLSEKSENIFKENMTFTIEPGIYIENQFGIRIENSYCLSSSGLISMTSSDKNITII